MPLENDFVLYAVGTGANVEDQTDYAASSIVATGAQSGVANSAIANKAWRLNSIISNVIASFIVAQANQPCVDNGSSATILANFEAALQAFILAGSGTRIMIKETWFTANATFTPLAITKAVEIDCVGGGGAGGTCPATSSSQNAVASGGWSGGWVRGRFNANFGTPSAGVLVTVGGGGPAASTPNGGTASSVASSAGGTLLVAGGGQPGNGTVGTTAIIAGASLYPSTNTGSGLVLNSGGTPGDYGTVVLFNFEGIGGQGGSSPFGGGGAGNVAISGAPGNPTGYGTGGAGAFIGESQSTAYGSAGMSGVCVIREYTATF